MIENLKDLQKLLKLCREHGVTEISLGSVSLKMVEAKEKGPDSIEELEAKEEHFIDALQEPLGQGEWAALANGA